jgi:hypothetical protein
MNGLTLISIKYDLFGIQNHAKSRTIETRGFACYNSVNFLLSGNIDCTLTRQLREDFFVNIRGIHPYYEDIYHDTNVHFIHISLQISR